MEAGLTRDSRVVSLGIPRSSHSRFPKWSGPPYKKIRKTGNPLLRRGQGLFVALRRFRLTTSPVQAGQARTEHLSKFIFGPEPDSPHLTIFFCTRPTDRQKIDFLKNYTSRFFQAKTCPGTSQNTPRSSPCLLYTSPSPRDTAISRMPSSA